MRSAISGPMPGSSLSPGDRVKVPSRFCAGSPAYAAGATHSGRPLPLGNTARKLYPSLLPVLSTVRTFFWSRKAPRNTVRVQANFSPAPSW